MFQMYQNNALQRATNSDIVSVSASTERGENSAEKAFDGDRSTRWESIHGIDKSWIMFELKPNKIIETMKIYWETAAAAEYDIEFSDDKKQWTTAYAVFDGKESEERGIKFPPTVTRYVGIFCKKRLGDYGYSILDVDLNPQIFLPEEKINFTEATASSSDSSSPMDAIDGNPSTRWGSKQGVDPQWLQVKFEKTEKVRVVKLQWEKASAKEYEIQLSMDGLVWKTAAKIPDGKESETRTIFLAPGEANYLRMFGKTRNGEWGYSLFELEAYR
jgi:hypothetical protein